MASMSALNDSLHSLIVSCRHRSVALESRLAKEARLEGPLNRLRAVPTLVRQRVKCVLLLEREPRRQSTQPTSGPRERGAAFRRRRITADGSRELSGAPRDPARPCLDQLVPRVRSTPANESIWILDRRKAFGVDHVDLGALPGSCGVLNRANRGCATRVVPIEAERQNVDPKPIETLERPRTRRRSAKRGDVLDPLRPELMHVHEPLHEDKLATPDT
jgi:hypothetical protein